MDSHQDVNQYIIEIVECLRSGHAAVMIGSGFSKNVETGETQSKKFPTWDGLGRLFSEKLYGNGAINSYYRSPLDLAEEVEAAFGRAVLDRILMDNIPDQEYMPSELHRKLLTLPWKDIFTTNYDTLLERTCESIVEKRYKIVLRKEDLLNSNDVPRIVKLHGSFPSQRPFIITREDYRRYPHDFAPFVNTVQQSMLENTFCLIGFSGEDPNFLSWLGWIHDNLGKSNSPKIYLLYAGEPTAARRKMLQDKNVVVVNLAAWQGTDASFDKCLPSFLGHLHSETDRHDTGEWVQKKIEIDEKLSMGEQIELLYAKLHENSKNYPGWVILPIQYRYILNYTIDNYRSYMSYLHDNVHQSELEFAYEIAWLIDRSLGSLEYCGVGNFEQILSRHSIEDIQKKGFREEQFEAWVSIKLALLRYYREKGENIKWESIFNDIQFVIDKIGVEAKERFYCEESMLYLFNFDIAKLKEKLKQWKLAGNYSVWALRKAGLLAEVGELQEAIYILRTALNDVRKRLNAQSKKASCYLLSLESCMMKLIDFIENSKSDLRSSDIGFNPQELQVYNQNRHAYQQHYSADVEEEIEYLKSRLSVEPTPYISQSRQYSFDIGDETISNHIGKDEEQILGIAYLRLFEDIGHPFRISHFVVGKASIGAAKRILSYSQIWSLVTIIRNGDKKFADIVFDRKGLALLDESSVNQFCSLYITTFRRLYDDFPLKSRYGIDNIAQSAVRILPEFLSRLCTKCSVENRDALLDIANSVYLNFQRYNYTGFAQVIDRLMHLYSNCQVIERIPKLLHFPIVEAEDYFSMAEFPDPFRYINGNIENVLNKLGYEIPEIDSLFEPVASNKQREKMLARLISLFFIGALSEVQSEKLRELIWNRVRENGYPRHSRYFGYIFVYLPHPEIDVKSRYVQYLFSELEHQNDLNSLIAGHDRLLHELPWAIKKNLVVIEKLDNVVNHCVNLLEQIFKALLAYNPDPFSMATRHDYFYYAVEIERLLVLLLLEEKHSYPFDGITKFVNEFKRHELPALCFQSMLHMNIGNSFNIVNCIWEATQKNPETVPYLYHEIDYCLQDSLCKPEEVENILEFLSGQMLWDRGKNVVNVVNIFTKYIYTYKIGLSEHVLVQLNRGLVNLANYSVITVDDDEQEVAQKLHIRKTAATLAFAIFKHSESDYVLEAIRRWKQICDDKNEFSEIRNCWAIE